MNASAKTPRGDRTVLFVLQIRQLTSLTYKNYLLLSLRLFQFIYRIAGVQQPITQSFQRFSRHHGTQEPCNH